MNLIRFYGVIAPNSTHRKSVTGYDKSNVEKSSAAAIHPNHHHPMSWAERLKRVFNIDITLCQHCQGNVRIVSCINDKTVIDKILDHII